MIEEELSDKYIVNKLRKLADEIENKNLNLRSISIQDTSYNGFTVIDATYYKPTIIASTKGAIIELKISNNLDL